MFFCFKQKSAYELRIGDWSSDVCSSDLSCGGAIPSSEIVPAFAHQVDDDVLERRRALVPGLRAGLAQRSDGALKRRRIIAAHMHRSAEGRHNARKRVAKGKSVSVRGGLGGRRIINKKKKNHKSLN